MITPFISFYTPSYKRPQQLARCLASVSAQTMASEIEQIVIPDHVGIGIDGMYRQLPIYAPTLRGRYVHFLADDDVLSSPAAVEALEDFAMARDCPPVIICKVEKGGSVYPCPLEGQPVMGAIDLGCVITRNDIWQQHVYDYQPCYEGDFWHVDALWRAGYPFAFWDYLFMRGAVNRGAPE